eukprot:750529-Rhodomonas_salina.3
MADVAKPVAFEWETEAWECAEMALRNFLPEPPQREQEQEFLIQGGRAVSLDPRGRNTGARPTGLSSSATVRGRGGGGQLGYRRGGSQSRERNTGWDRGPDYVQGSGRGGCRG